jgi:hypothetical protein
MHTHVHAVHIHAARGLSGRLDSPLPGDDVRSFLLPLRGWVVGADRPVIGVEGRTEEGPLGMVPADAPRQDVVDSNPSLGQRLQCGFQHNLSLLDLPPRFRFHMDAVTDLGTKHPFATIEGERTPLGAPSRWRPLLISTLGRTGSTWVMHLLAQHPDVSSYRPFAFEARALEYWVSVLRSLGRPSSALQILAADFSVPNWWVGEGPPLPIDDVQDPEILVWLSGTSVERLAAFCRSQVEGFYDTFTKGREGGSHELDPAGDSIAPRGFIEKVSGSPGINRLALELWPRGRELFLVRDFRDMFASMLAFNRKKGQAGFGRHQVGSDAALASALRESIVALRGQLAARSDRAVLLRYEDVIRDPERTTAGLLRDLQLPDSEGIVRTMLDDARQTSRVGQSEHRTTSDAEASIGRWRRDLTPALQDACKDAFEDLLPAFGYDPDA